MKPFARFLMVVAMADLTGVVSGQAQRLEDTDYLPLDHPAIRYIDRDPTDPVARLQAKLEKHQAKLEYQPGGLGYLPSLLKLLDINPDSQVLVFSKSSAQSQRISPQRPRAIYFNDNVSVGYVQTGEVLEMAALDPKQGVINYTLDAGKTANPMPGRRQDCLLCHQGGQTLGVPGLVVSSAHPVTPGAPVEHGTAGTLTDGRTPIEERWGGWYISGKLGSQKHLGVPIDGDTNEHFDTSRYLATTSDVVALMTLEHQTRMSNLITRVGWEVRLDSPQDKVNLAIEDMVGYMLFADEAPLHQPVEGASGFSRTFPERGPRDKQGRSLRDFDLHTRLFRYPLSYMIYTEAFDSMPGPAKDRIYRRLYEVLTGQETSAKFARLTAGDKRAILEILVETKKGLPEYFKLPG